MRQKNILIVTLEYPPDIGGIASYVDQFASALQPDNVTVLAPPAENSKEHDVKKDFTIYRKKFYFPKFIWPRWFILFLSMKKIVQQENIEMIYLHHVLPVGYVAWLMKKIYGMPYLIFSHGTDIVRATENRWKRFWLEYIIKHSEQVITNSKSLNSRMLESVSGVAKDKTTVLYPCPEDKFKQTPNKTKIEELKDRLGISGKKVILTVSRLIKGKGLEYLTKILSNILQNRSHLVWVIVGEGPLKDQIQKLIHKYNLQNLVRFIGEVEHNKLPIYYHMSDLFVLLPHPYQGKEEGLGLVFLEAAAAGLPVVAGDSGGVKEAVVDGETGYVVDTFQDSAVKEAIIKLIKNDELAKQMGLAAKDRIKSKFIWEEQLKKINQWRYEKDKCHNSFLQ